MKHFLTWLMTLVLLIPILLSTSAVAGEAPAWQVELDESIQGYDFVGDGKYLFFTNEEYIWLYEAASGKQVYAKEIEDYEEEGVHQLVDNYYIVSAGDGVQMWDVIKGEVLWNKEFDGISQSDYTALEAYGDVAVLRYGEDHVAFNMETGDEIWRAEIDYRGSLAVAGAWNYTIMRKLNKFLVLNDDDNAVIYDVNNGKALATIEDVEPNTDLIEKKLLWAYRPASQSHYVFVTNDGAVLIDLVNNKELARREFDIDGDYNVILPTPNGCAVLGEEKVVYFNFADGSVKELPFPVDDMRTFKSYTVGNTGVLLMSMKDQLFGIDLEAGKILWNTPKDDEMFEGFAHRYITTEGDNAILVYNRARLVSQEAGTYLYCMNINLLTGKVNYAPRVLLSHGVWTDFQRGLASTITGAFATFVTVASGGIAAGQAGKAIDAVSDMMGYSNIGFDYNYFEYKDMIIFEGRDKVDMMDPETRDNPGEGYVGVNKKTGEIVFKDYFELCGGMYGNLFAQIAAPVTVGNVRYIAGEERLVAFDLDAGKRLWFIEDNEKLALVSDMHVVDGVVYVKYGIQNWNVGLAENEIKAKTSLDEDPYGFMAVDGKTGDILWDKELESAPGLYSPQFSIENYYSLNTNRLYFSDAENIYSLKMGRDGGDFEWTFNFADNKVGELDYEETYAIDERWIGSKVRTYTTTTPMGGGWAMKTTHTSGGLDADRTAEFYEDAAGAQFASTYTSWGNIWGVTAKRCLRVLYNGQMILAMGPDGIASVSPDGKTNWAKEWDYDNEDVQYVPQIINNKILYCYDKQLTLMDLNTGEQVWQVEEAEKPRFFSSPDRQSFFSIDDDVITGYKL